MHQKESALLYVLVIMASGLLLFAERLKTAVKLNKSNTCAPNYSRFCGDRAPFFITDAIFRNKV